MSKDKNSKEYLQSFLEKWSSFLLERESTFISSLIAQSDYKSEFSFGQERWLGIIYQKYNSEVMEEEELWADGFSQRHRDEALQVAKYYSANPPYYSNYVSTILSNPQHFTLTKRDWNKFCCNKYAKKIREIHRKELKFQKGDCIQIRSNNRLDLANYNPETSHPNKMCRNYEKNKVGFVIGIDSKPVTRAAAGSRIYSILLTGDVSTIFAHESDLKRKRG
jgi:hypothetical protein|tara:strand:+ start:2621 stop:3283 length:663 start_codon:yes stop_codon:yes gene_type:complete